jgi:ABC-2 type transport system permease protein
VVPRLFRLVQIGHWTDLVAFLFPYLLACVFFSMTISGIAHNREVFIIMFVFSSVPLLFISGISWPSCAVPPFWKAVSWFFPSTFGINGFVKISSMGALLRDVHPELVGLWIQVVVYGITAWLVYYRSYGRHLKDIIEVAEVKLQARWAEYM